MRWHVYSTPGYRHDNQDAVVVRPHPEDDGVLLCALADGQGGRSGGAAAARMAVEQSLQAASSMPADRLFDPTSWYGIISAADEAVCEDDAAGFSTLVALCASDRAVCGASCGDSGVILVCGDQARVLTDDQRKDPPIGSGAAYPVAFSARLTPPWKLIIVSDGVWRYVGWEEIARPAVNADGEDLIAHMREAALEANGGALQDDFSVILIRGPFAGTGGQA